MGDSSTEVREQQLRKPFNSVLPYLVPFNNKMDNTESCHTNTRVEGERRETRKRAGRGRRGAEGSRELCTFISEMRWEGRGAWCSQAREQPLRSPRAAGSGPWARSMRLTAAFTSLLISAASQREDRKGVIKAALHRLTMPTHALPCHQLALSPISPTWPPTSCQSTFEKLGQPLPLPGPYL